MLHHVAFHLGLHCFPNMHKFKSYHYTKGSQNLPVYVIGNLGHDEEWVRV